MNALIFAAGLGTRLAKFTKDKPKALVEVDGKPMLLHAIEKLREVGVQRIVVNVHHHAQMIDQFVKSLSFEDTEILLSDERGELLETGGGLIKAAPLFLPDQPIILYNSDVLTGASLKEMVEYHYTHGGMATLMVKKRKTSRYFLFDSQMRLSGWRNINTGDEIITRNVDEYNLYAFSGIHIVNFEIIKELGELRKFSITNGYLDISQKCKVFGWKDWDEYWFDIGTPEKLMHANDFFADKRM